VKYKEKYKITIYIKEPEGVKAAPPIYVDTPQEAFVRSILLLKLAVRQGEGDIFLLVRDKEANSTIVSEITDESLLVEVYPNILSNNVDRIGPYSMESKTWLGGIAEA
tara:strand:- start:896 stop:1219 length:324 start_codon:yes stop_codon:yes gene_type:complete